MKALVTGGGGFLGKTIVKQLLTQGDTVRSLSRSAYPELDALGVETVRGDLADEAAVGKAVQGCDIVFHVAAKAGVWGPYEDYYDCNVTGTRNILKACKDHGVSKLVYTSTPSVTFAGKDEEGVDESIGYAETFLNHYAKTKALAEQRVLGANAENLSTVALRPHLIWGPEDNHLVPRVIDRAKKGKLKLVGSGRNLVDSVYVDNAAEAHLLAANALAPEASCAGKAYFITNGEPLPMADLLNKILAAADLPPVTRSVPPAIAYGVGATLEKVYGLLGRPDEPIMTRFVARQLATAHWFDITAAKRDLGYTPRVSIDEGMNRLAAWLAS
jgi:nucleoside-diphosphate-sugar epimerase